MGLMMKQVALRMDPGAVIVKLAHEKELSSS
jgi:hypothetical protein